MSLLTVDLPRCPVCRIVLLEGDSALWCAVAKCPETDQRFATQQQRAELKMNEPPMPRQP